MPCVSSFVSLLSSTSTLPPKSTHQNLLDAVTCPFLDPQSPHVSTSFLRRFKPSPSPQGSESDDSGIFNERILLLVFRTIKWDLRTLCITASLNRKLRAIAERLLWRELCFNRAPRMLAALTTGAPNARVGGGWNALAKLMFFCCGCQSSRHFKVAQPLPGHFVHESRFSKTSGQSFLTKKCRGDLLYVSDPCEHSNGRDEDDLGIYRGIFRGFMRSKTRAFLIKRQVRLEETTRCPYCGARVWSMTTARLVPKSVARRLGTHDGGLEYFVCVNGHLHGSCWLVPLSSEEDDGGNSNDDDDDEGEEEEEEVGFYGEVGEMGFDDRTVTDESRSSRGGGPVPTGQIRMKLKVGME